MNSINTLSSRAASLAIGAMLLSAAPALATESEEDGSVEAEAPEARAQPGPPASGGEGGPPPGIDMSDSVFDDTWLTLGIGAGLVPSYSGSDDYVVFPLPLIVGRVGGIGITPNGPGLNFDVLSQPPGDGPAETSFSFGPSFRFRNNRADQIEDEVVKAAGELDTALEVGVNAGVTFPGVLNPFDRLTVSGTVRWDVLDAHNGMLVEPAISYFTPVSRGAALQLTASAEFVDDDFADYYYSVSPAQSAASGLPEFQADGGFNSFGLTAIGTVDLDGNLMNGGWNVYGIAGYSRLVGDAKDTPYTSIRGSADQFIGGLGVGYTF